MYLDNQDFINWMEKFDSKLNVIGKDLKALVNKKDIFDEDDKLMDNQDLAFLLKVSYRTLQRYRDSKKLAFFMVGRKVFYRMADVKDFIQSYASKNEVMLFNKAEREGKLPK